MGRNPEDLKSRGEKIVGEIIYAVGNLVRNFVMFWLKTLRYGREIQKEPLASVGKLGRNVSFQYGNLERTSRFIRKLGRARQNLV